MYLTDTYCVRIAPYLCGIVTFLFLLRIRGPPDWRRSLEIIANRISKRDEDLCRVFAHSETHILMQPRNKS